jgi:hypothetical protein
MIMPEVSVDDQLAAAKLKRNELTAAEKAADERVRETRADLVILRRSRESKPGDIAIIESKLVAAQVRAKEAGERVAAQRVLVEHLEANQACERKQAQLANVSKRRPSLLECQNKLSVAAEEVDAILRASGADITFKELFDVTDEIEAGLRFQLFTAALRLAHYKNPIQL